LKRVFSYGKVKEIPVSSLAVNHGFNENRIPKGHKIPIKSKMKATGIAIKMNTRHTINILKNVFSILTPGLSSRSIIISIISTKIRKN